MVHSTKLHGTYPIHRGTGLQAAFPMIRAMALELRSQSMVLLGPMMPNLSRSRNGFGPENMLGKYIPNDS